MADDNTVDKPSEGQDNEPPQERPWQEVLKELGPGKPRREEPEPSASSRKPESGGEGETGEGEGGEGSAATGGEGSGSGDDGGLRLDKEALSAIFTEAVKAAQPPPQPKQLTEDEIRQALNIFTASDAHLKQLGLEATPEKVEALNTILQAVAKQATSVATFELRAAVDALTERIKPLFNHMEQTRMDSMKQRFFKKHQDLEGLEPLVVVAYQNLKARGATFKGEDEAFKAVAEETRGLLSKVPGYNAGKRGNDSRAKQEEKRPTPPRKMPTLSSGGQGGAGDRSGQPSGPKWKSVFRDG